MQIICSASKHWLAAVLLLLSPHSIAAEFKLSQAIGIGSVLTLGNRHERIEGVLNNQHGTRALFIDDRLKDRLRDADEVQGINSKAFIIDHQPAFAAVVRLPSNSLSPQGFCGAGHEDFLVLVSLKDERLFMLDEQLLQSCLQSLSLTSDQGDDPSDALQPMAFPWIAKVETISASQVGSVTRCIRIQGEKLVAEDCPASAGTRQ